MRASQGDIQETVLCSLEDMVAFEQSASALFTVMDKDHDGYLLKEEFLSVAQDGAHRLFFAALGLEYSDYEELHALFCHHLKTVNIDEAQFVECCRRFRSNAKYSDVVWLRRALGIALHKLDDVEAKINTVNARMDGMRSYVYL
mmetsp:Transcript_43824/g.98647  ORF Transcript_43824/g.98647 Transcript_43824/m.98647 type:complete len:144 (-) Transcript_43824:201-632(-)